MSRTVAFVFALVALMAAPFSAQHAAAQEERLLYQLTRQANVRVVLDAVESHMNEPGQRRIALVARGGGVRAMVAGAVDAKGEPYEPALRRLMARGVDVIVCHISLDTQRLEPAQVATGRMVPAGAGEVERLLSLGYREMQ